IRAAAAKKRKEEEAIIAANIKEAAKDQKQREAQQKAAGKVKNKPMPTPNLSQVQNTVSAPIPAPARPIPLNSISAPVHTSNIAAAQAACNVAIATKGKYIMEPKLDNKGKPTKDFILYEVEPNSNRKIKVADITFTADENTQKKMMTAKFNTPIKEDTIGDAIKVIASVAAQCQPNDTTLYAKKPSGITSTFSNSDYNALVTTNCNEQFEKKHSQERTPQSLPSIAKDNNTVTNTADLALKEEKPSAPQKLSMH
ncbi:MAG TPA: hypothetical protein PLL67_04350, partial [Gammaproteobacteria bacterium]|nr:hypothetical protein [Gammaproteobacteria bacterium]